MSLIKDCVSILGQPGESNHVNDLIVYYSVLSGKRSIVLLRVVVKPAVTTKNHLPYRVEPILMAHFINYGLSKFGYREQKIFCLQSNTSPQAENFCLRSR